MFFTNKQIAEVCHEANRAFCRTIEDYTQLPWALAAEWQRNSAIDGVAFAIDNPNAAASAQHDSWLAAKKADGWTFGPAKEPRTKEHPCMVPYEQLPAEQRLKDHLFKAVVAAFITCMAE